ncbi:hypothetical protein [Terriglobus saanensis]|uniref:Secreted protein n=1 Tax=Terriglobus saanensis (strain ATCC BAA-1853 / DSM 23119 / SP1PR4) TaxID=401053 RepID=E8V7B2_TERSS|nr:hypothetical protein [Terriglobus saanensis]ADV82825.1 hypothetical protein AciPR4_2021 [Terriglobus saanensis SP1PR4]
MKRHLLTLLAGLVLALASVPARALELRITAKALERTLQAQLFTNIEGRYYMRGDPNSACFVYADQPHVSFQDDRVVVHVRTNSRLGTGMFGKCVGLGFNTQADVSFIPDAEGETIGFRDARIERFTGNKELDFLVVPFLSRKLPQQMKVNAADMLRSLLATSLQSTGYAMKLTNLKIHSMQVQKDVLIVDLDGSLDVD